MVVVSFAMRPPLKRWLSAHLARYGDLRTSAIAPMPLVLLLSAALTSELGVFAIIDGFVIGVALHADRRFAPEWKSRVAPLVNTLFLPIFFTYTGLRTDVGTLDSAKEPGLCALLCRVAFVAKLRGAWAGARLFGEDNRSTLTIGKRMNTRALMELVGLNVRDDLGVPPRSMFTKLVSTYIATPLIRRLIPGQQPLDLRTA